MKGPVFGALFALAACSAAQPRPGSLPAPSQVERIETGLLPPVLVKGEDHRFSLAERMREHRIPAVSIAVVIDYRVAWAKAYGLADAETAAPATTETLFQAGSISKPVSALAALLAVTRGELALDAPINDALTSWKLPDNELTRLSPVTLRRLLSHTAGTTVHGFPGYESGTPLPTVPQVLDGKEPANSPAVRVDLAPGTQFRYSGGGFTIVQQALVDRLGRPFPAILHDTVLAPLDMNHSTYEQPLPADRLTGAAAGHDWDGKVIVGKRNVYPEMAAAGLWTTPSDLARFFIAIQLSRAGQPSRIPPKISRQMTSPVIKVGGDDAVGLGLFMFQKTHSFGHDGADAGFQSFALFSLDHGYGVVIMANSDNGFRIFEEIVRGVAAEYGWENRPPTIERAPLSPRLAALPGRFAVAKLLPFVISAQGTHLMVRRPFADATELVPLEDGTLVNIGTGAHFKIDAQAREVTIIHPNGEEQHATRLGDEERMPILELEAGHYEAALAAYLEMQKATPDSPALSEMFLNNVGLEELSRKHFENAIAVLRINVALHPDAMNTYDSLGEAYAKAGDVAKAIAAYEQSLATMARDHTTPPPFMEMLRKNGEKQLSILRAKRP